jgi:hypothetical protein
MFWTVPNEEIKKIKKTNHLKWIIPLGTFLAIAGICVTLVLLGSKESHNSSKPASSTMTAAVPAVEITPSTSSLNGKWAASLESSTMLATVTDDGIEIQWANGDTSALYWKGTFPVPANHGAKFTVESEGDLHAMDESMLASEDLTKTFTYENNTINFSLTVIGVTTKVHLAR